MRNALIAVAVVASLSLIGCNSDSSSTPTVPDNGTPPTVPDNGTALPEPTLALGIGAVPQALAETYTKALKFNRHTKVASADGGAIHIVAQDQLSDNQIVRVRNVLQHYLAPYPGSEYGANKDAIGNKMAENGAILLLLNGSDDGTNPAAELDGQPLYHDEIQVEGGPWYTAQNYEHRDATFEEILHLVHDYGIGVDQNASFAGVLPEYQAEIRAAQIEALNDNRWGIGSQDWIDELTAENSLSQEYLASLIDAYYGLWGAWDESSDHSMWGLYYGKTREQLPQSDPQGWALMQAKLFHPYLTYNARIDASFSGDFSLRFDASKPYTHHAQYLQDITLTGSNPVNVVVNQRNNHISGNDGSNTVLFSGSSAQYQWQTDSNGVTTVEDMVDNRDGVNRLQAIEQLGFTDTVVTL
ncbi:hypothetical protein [uncultured Ferrimonas sp.]|uniref:hypothetical protein n=1 Tax=uncultured Ferrimonas sp. TaxID=432640 RepID=UPI002628F87A|nr:hypothetical protein [uncultured Ferrimonas sp.]